MSLCNYCQCLLMMPATRAPNRCRRGINWSATMTAWRSAGGAFSAVFFLIPFCLAWNAFLIGWYSIALSGHGPDGAFGWLMIVFPVAHVAVGVGLIYTVLTMLFNATVLRLDRGMLSITHGPIYFPGLSPVEADAITQLFCVESRNGDRESRVQYELRALLRDGRTQTLLDHLPDCNEALYLEQRLEAKLRLRDELVPGELPR